MTWTSSAHRLLAQELPFLALLFEPGGFARYMVAAGTRWPGLGYSHHLEEEAGTPDVGWRQGIESGSCRSSVRELQEDMASV
jgi:hypothetical protein